MNHSKSHPPDFIGKKVVYAGAESRLQSEPHTLTYKRNNGEAKAKHCKIKVSALKYSLEQSTVD